MARSTKSTLKKARWERRWLEAFRREKSVAAACKSANLDRSTVYKRRKENEEFARQWDEIENETIDLLEKSAMARAIAGHDNPIFFDGQEVGRKREYETALTIFMLKKRRPDIYSDKVDDKAQRLEELKVQMARLMREMEQDLQDNPQ